MTGTGAAVCFFDDFCLSTFAFPVVSTEQDISTFVDACRCFDMNAHLLYFISRDVLGCRMSARNSVTVQPKNARNEFASISF